MSFLNGKCVIMAVNFIRMYVNRARMNVNFIRMNVNLVKICVKKASINVKKTNKKVKQIRMKVNLERKRVNLTIVSNSRYILTDKKDPLRNNELQAHFAGAKRQQHLQKELVQSAKLRHNQTLNKPHQTRTQNKLDKMAATNRGFAKVGLYY